jgi:hypothetical protein
MWTLSSLFAERSTASSGSHRLFSAILSGADETALDDFSFPFSTTSTSTVTTRRSTVAASLQRAIRPTSNAAATTTTKTMCVWLPLSLSPSPNSLALKPVRLSSSQPSNARATQDHQRGRVTLPVQSKLHGSSTQRRSSHA